MAPLRGADGEIYAMAQGSLVVGGRGGDAADGSKFSVNIPSAGRIPNGATVERAVDAGFANSPELRFNLAEADLTTAQRVADAINGDLGQIASATDAVTISIAAPVGAETRSALMSRIENPLVDPAEADRKSTRLNSSQ